MIYFAMLLALLSRLIGCIMIVIVIGFFTLLVSSPFILLGWLAWVAFN